MAPFAWKKSTLNILAQMVPFAWKKSSLNISGTDGPTWVKADKQAKKNKSNKNIYKQKQTIEKTGESNKLPKYAQ